MLLGSYKGAGSAAPTPRILVLIASSRAETASRGRVQASRNGFGAESGPWCSRRGSSRRSQTCLGWRPEVGSFHLFLCRGRGRRVPIRYDDATGDQYVTRWSVGGPSSSARGTSATSLGPLPSPSRACSFSRRNVRSPVSLAHDGALPCSAKRPGSGSSGRSTPPTPAQELRLAGDCKGRARARPGADRLGKNPGRLPLRDRPADARRQAQVCASSTSRR